jgi:phytoene/squalene synthetase
VLTAFDMSRESKDAPTSGGSNEPVATATAPVLARWLGISGKAVYELGKAGVLVHVSRDHFLLEESLRRYCEHIRGDRSAALRSASTPCTISRS